MHKMIRAGKGGYLGIMGRYVWGDAVVLRAHYILLRDATWAGPRGIGPRTRGRALRTVEPSSQFIHVHVKVWPVKTRRDKAHVSVNCTGSDPGLTRGMATLIRVCERGMRHMSASI